MAPSWEKDEQQGGGHLVPSDTCAFDRVVHGCHRNHHTGDVMPDSTTCREQRPTVCRERSDLSDHATPLAMTAPPTEKKGKGERVVVLVWVGILLDPSDREAVLERFGKVFGLKRPPRIMHECDTVSDHTGPGKRHDVFLYMDVDDVAAFEIVRRSTTLSRSMVWVRDAWNCFGRRVWPAATKNYLRKVLRLPNGGDVR